VKLSQGFDQMAWNTAETIGKTAQNTGFSSIRNSPVGETYPFWGELRSIA
jgi:hypothetical protein